MTKQKKKLQRDFLIKNTFLQKTCRRARLRARRAENPLLLTKVKTRISPRGIKYPGAVEGGEGIYTQEVGVTHLLPEQHKTAATT